MPQDQGHVDLILLIRTLVCELSVLVDFIHVPGHQDDDIPRYLFTQEQKLNIDMNTLARKTLRRAIRNSHYIESAFPCEPFRLSLQGKKIFCSPTKALGESFSQHTACFFYDSKNIISSPDFDLVYWDAFERVIVLWPQTVRVSYSKILVKLIGVNHFLNRISHEKNGAKYPCCPHPDKTTEHIILCQNNARTT